MRNCWNRTEFVALLCTTTFMLGGCFDLMGNNVDDAVDTAGDPDPVPRNNAPTISGNPPSAVMVGNNYFFAPAASDPDGDTLTFSIQNQPTWASFDPSSGTLSGVAVLGSEGMYANIQISVSDGNQSSSTPQFSIDVTQVALGSVTLSWTPPTQNDDGSSLTDLAGYNIYYGFSAGNYPNRIQINNPGIATFVVDNLTPNTYHFVSTSFNSSGIESDFSNEATMQIL